MKINKDKDKRKLVLTIITISIIAVSLVPMLYCTIYLGSVWDVYGKINTIPVAFVNRDKAVTKDGKEYAIGRGLMENLKDNNKVAWKFVNHDQAMKGVEGTDYYAVIEIPEDFSQKIADAQDGKFIEPEMIYIGNKGRNFVFSQVSLKVGESIKTEISSSIQKEVSKALVDSLYDVKVSVKDAGEGLGNLQYGIQRLENGSEDLSSGIASAADGSAQLKAGLVNASNGASAIQSGTQKLIDGSNSLAAGIGSAVDGSSKLKNGLSKLYDGQSKITGGTEGLIRGLNSLKADLTVPNDDLPRLAAGAQSLSDGIANLKDSAKDLSYNNVKALADGAAETGAAISTANSQINQALLADIKANMNASDQAKLAVIIGAIQQLNNKDISTNMGGSLSAMADSVKPLPDTLEALNSGAGNVSEGIKSLIKGLSDSQAQAASGVDALIIGVNSIKNGSMNSQAGLNTIAEKTDELSAGLQMLNDGAVSLSTGLKDADSGAENLKEGLSTAAVKTGTLSDGLNKLNGGSISLNEGLISANEGAIKLKNGLESGYDKINNNLKFNSDNMSQFVSEPVTTKDNSINDVKYYGMGLAPYFISLSLWLGAMLLTAIFTIAKTKKIFKSKFMCSFMGRYTVGAGIVSGQAILVSFTFIKVLGAAPVSISGFYANNILAAFTFFSIMYGAAHALGILSSPVMFIVMLLQLASSGGTFPIETAPAFYRVINKFIPMTYSVNTLRMTLSGINSSVLSHNILIMLSFILIFMCGGAILKALINLGRERMG